MSTPAVEVRTSPTPILDRIAPLPQPRGASFFEVWIGLVLSVVVVIPFFWGTPFMKKFLAWVGTNIKLLMANSDWAGVRVILTGFAIALVCSAAILIHECGHLLAGLALGFRCKSFRFGRVKIDRGFKISRYQDSEDAALGWACMVPVRWKRLRPRATAMILAGPMANLLSAYLMFHLRSEQSLISGSFIAVSVYFGAGNLLPTSLPGHISDGRRLWMLVFDKERSERYLAILKVQEQLARDAAITSLDPTDIASATAVQDESPETSWGYLVAYLSARSRNDHEEAAHLLETALRFSASATATLRQFLGIQAGFFQTKLGRIELGEKWLVDVPADTTFTAMRSELESAIEQSKGHQPQSSPVSDSSCRA